MECGNPPVPETKRGEKNTATNTNLTFSVQLGVALVRVHYLFVSPVVIMGIPQEALLNQNLLVLALVILIGLAGAAFRRKQLTTLASGTLLLLLVWGKLAIDFLKTSPPDTAVFLVQFGMVLFFMEANLVVTTFYASRRELEEKEDELSQALEGRLTLWLRNQLSRQTKIAFGSLGLSVLLLPLAGFTSISSDQLPFTAALLLLAVVTFLFLVTHRREPAER